MDFEEIKNRAIASGKHLGVFLKWSILSIIIGFVVGGFSSVFSLCMTFVTNYRLENPDIVYLMPLGGLFIVFLYKISDMEKDKGTNRVISAVNEKEEVPGRMAPLIFIATITTHLFGGSAGREGAALQMGGSIGNTIGKLLKLSEQDKKIMVMCGMSASFSALFGTPIAAAIFPVEVVSVGVMYFVALVPCVFASLIASNFAATMGISPEAFSIEAVAPFTAVNAGKIIAIAVLCALISMLFCFLLHFTGGIFIAFFKNQYLRVLVASAIILGVTFLLGSRDYMGAGIPVIEKAMEGNVVFYAFIIKMLLTAVTLAGGFKGGEIVPSFFVGATFGCLMGQLFGISPSLCAAVGMVAVFCGVTNCPISSILIGIELFGFEGVYYILIAVAISFMLSGYTGLYRNQKIIYSKYEAKFININTQ
ncbi:MAG: chloride channel protein [Lachnospiraceae bacterium]|nr:chloride channel protein [Lachnospiraceae bacterium]